MAESRGVQLTPSTIAFGLRNPRVALLRVLLGRDEFICHGLAQLTGAERSTVDQFYTKIATPNELENHIRAMLDEAGGEYRGQVSFEDAYLLYTACRLIRPRLVVETGVATGVSSAYILKALDDNSYGMLHSIDMPNYEEVLAKSEPAYAWMKGHPVAMVPQDKEVGFTIPANLRTRWKLHLGLSSNVLPKVLSELGQIDIFVHDSEHTYKNMMFEYQTAWPSIKANGIPLLHDVRWNTAFSDFCIQVNRRPALSGQISSLGGLRK